MIFSRESQILAANEGNEGLIPRPRKKRLLRKKKKKKWDRSTR
jgi:hypothetical protein